MKPPKWKGNDIIEAAVAGGLNKWECAVDSHDAAARITHVPSKSYFLLEGGPGAYTTTAVVGDLPPQVLQAATWPMVTERVQRWARDVKRDVETPDLWAELQRERDILTGARYEDVENTPFTSSEQAEIAEQFRQITELVRGAYSLSEAHMLPLEAKLDEAAVAAGRMGRKDWQLLVWGTMFELIVTGLLPPDAVRDIFTAAFHALGHLFGIPPQLPPMT